MTWRYTILGSLFLALSILLPTAARTETFSPSSLLSPGALTALHAKYENDCLKCHALGKGVPDEKCLDCHREIRERLAAKKGYHAAVSGRCFECHTDHKGSGYSIVKKELLKPPAFDHKNTGFPLAGKHAVVECNKCHKTGSYLKLRPDCLSCHKEPHKNAFEGSSCTDCHSFAAWKPSVFKHEKAKFKLEGAHREAQCKACHSAGIYRGRKHDSCADCHSEPHKRQFAPLACSECHTVTGSWTPDAFKHDRAKFKLEGPHKKAQCKACHSAGIFRGRKHDSCAQCHSEPHKKQFAPVACGECHTVTGAWTPDAFKHEKAKFKLEGAHREAQCKACHGAGIYRGRKHDSCADCHSEPHKRQFATLACSECHTVTGSWTPDAFKHDRAKFKLEGAHKEAQCKACHGAGIFRGRKHDSCAECHSEPHKRQFEPVACGECHTVTGNWTPDAFKHDRAKFKLEGAHKKAQCKACHSAGIFRGRKHDSCAECHSEPHKRQFEPVACSECHTVTGSWTPDAFKHDRAKFKLEGPHKEAACKACHGAGVFRGRKHASCAECHVDPHKGLRGAVCTKCHKQNSWDLDMASHAGGIFPLQGRHARLTCTDCHKNGVFAGSGRQCAGCHADPHRNQFGSSDCGKCHTASGWLPPAFLHVQAGFVLDGRHRTADCEKCHAGRNYRNTPTQCDRCHQANYLNSRNPGHQAAGIAGDCRTCHNTTSWSGAQFNHRFYFLYGPHNSAMRCNDCHTSSTVYGLSATRCSVCHPQPIHPGHAQPVGGMPAHTGPHPHGHEPCGECHYTDTWKRTRMPGM